ncbi:uncharacterized protein LOC110854013 isoform X2 [Folsomia candida]|uniref:uncharacterized protein LOC110854013 isoform X2 n=1 Tax=Folsomia candida TaxID=158441 RepID=UPI0016053794|nr:uncharacterized protein LOC110854013 isoform X2 [Folsomia candida]
MSKKNNSRIPQSSSNFSSSTTSKSRNKPSSSLLQHDFPPEHATQSEDLLKFFKSLGYEAPKNLKPEHLDYVFKDEKMTQLLKTIMSKLKPGNVLSEDEVKDYERLRSEGLLLFGEELEKAVDHRKALDRRNSDKTHDDELKTQELKRLIALREQEILDIKKRQETIRRMDALRQESNASQDAINSHYQKESANLKVAILVAKKRIMDKAQALQMTKEELLKHLDLNDNANLGDQFMGEWDWDTFIENEDSLNQEIREFGKKYIPTLLRESERVRPQTEDDSHVSEAITQQLSKFERLRHSIVYEEVRRVKLARKLAAAQVAVQVLDDISANGMDVRSEQEVEDSIKILEVQEKNEFNEVLQKVRVDTLEKVDSRFQGLIESRNLAKKRLELGMSGLYDMLEAQTVRLDLVGKLISTNAQPLNQLKDTILNIEQELATIDLDGRGATAPKPLTPEGDVLSQIFQQLGYPEDTIHSANKRFNAIRKIYQTIERDELEIAAREQTEEEEKLKKVSRQCQDLKLKFEKLKIAAIPSQKVEKLKAEVEEKQNLVKEQKSSVAEVLLRKKQLLAEMKALL